MRKTNGKAQDVKDERPKVRYFPHSDPQDEVRRRNWNAPELPIYGLTFRFAPRPLKDLDGKYFAAIVTVGEDGKTADVEFSPKVNRWDWFSIMHDICYWLRDRTTMSQAMPEPQPNAKGIVIEFQDAELRQLYGDRLHIALDHIHGWHPTVHGAGEVVAQRETNPVNVIRSLPRIFEEVWLKRKHDAQEQPAIA